MFVQSCIQRNRSHTVNGAFTSNSIKPIRGSAAAQALIIKSKSSSADSDGGGGRGGGKGRSRGGGGGRGERQQVSHKAIASSATKSALTRQLKQQSASVVVDSVRCVDTDTVPRESPLVEHSRSVAVSQVTSKVERKRLSKQLSFNYDADNDINEQQNSKGPTRFPFDLEASRNSRLGDIVSSSSSRSLSRKYGNHQQGGVQVQVRRGVDGVDLEQQRQQHKLSHLLLRRNKRLINHVLAGPLLLGHCLTKGLHDFAPPVWFTNTCRKPLSLASSSRRNLQIVSAFCFSFISYQLETLRLLAQTAATCASTEPEPSLLISNTQQANHRYLNPSAVGEFEKHHIPLEKSRSCPATAEQCYISAPEIKELVDEQQPIKPPLAPRTPQRVHESQVRYSLTMPNLFNQVHEPVGGQYNRLSGDSSIYTMQSHINYLSTQADQIPKHHHQQQCFERSDYVKNNYQYPLSNEVSYSQSKPGNLMAICDPQLMLSKRRNLRRTSTATVLFAPSYVSSYRNAYQSNDTVSTGSSSIGAHQSVSAGYVPYQPTSQAYNKQQTINQRYPPPPPAPPPPTQQNWLHPIQTAGIIRSGTMDSGPVDWPLQNLSLCRVHQELDDSEVSKLERLQVSCTESSNSESADYPPDRLFAEERPVIKSLSDKDSSGSKQMKRVHQSEHNLNLKSEEQPAGKVTGDSTLATTTMTTTKTVASAVQSNSKLQVQSQEQRVKSKRSPSPSKLSLAGARRRLWQRQKGLSSLSVQRSEEVAPIEARHLVRQNTTSCMYDSKVSLRWASFWIDSLKNPNIYMPDARCTFVEGLGIGQVASRQAFVSPYLGDIQISLCDQRGLLEVEIVRARCLHKKVSSTTLPSPFVKMYLMKDHHCIAKSKTQTARQTLDPLYQKKFLFRNDYANCMLQVIVWGDYGRKDRKSLMGIVQIQLSELDLSNLVLSWYKLLNPPSMADSLTSSKPTSRISKSGTA